MTPYDPACLPRHAPPPIPQRTLAPLHAAAAGPIQDIPADVSLRQLRHQTKNALQRLLIEVASCDALQRDAAGRTLAADLQRRIGLSAALSDALFGLTQPPGPLWWRLDGLCKAVLGLLGDADQFIALDVSVDAECPDALAEPIIRIAHELVGNAVKHGMRLRMIGRIDVRVHAAATRVLLTVSDDGWGCCEDAGRGDGLQIAHILAHEHGGRLRLVRERGRTVAEVALPRVHA
jgi:two-component sensor histidine kinase